MPDQTENEYQLTPAEQMVFSSLNQQVANAKIVVYNLNAALERALKDVDKAEAQFGGALAFLGNSHGFGSVVITPDFSRITTPKGA